MARCTCDVPQVLISHELPNPSKHPERARRRLLMAASPPLGRKDEASSMDLLQGTNPLLRQLCVARPGRRCLASLPFIVSAEGLTLRPLLSLPPPLISNSSRFERIVSRFDHLTCSSIAAASRYSTTAQHPLVRSESFPPPFLPSLFSACCSRSFEGPQSSLLEELQDCSNVVPGLLPAR